MTLRAFSPDGHRIIGTSDLIPGTALGTVTKDADGNIVIEWEGETKIHWDAQYTERSNMETVYVNEIGENWVESALEWREVEEDQS